MVRSKKPNFLSVLTNRVEDSRVQKYTQLTKDIHDRFRLSWLLLGTRGVPYIVMLLSYTLYREMLLLFRRIATNLILHLFNKVLQIAFGFFTPSSQHAKGLIIDNRICVLLGPSSFVPPISSRGGPCCACRIVF